MKRSHEAFRILPLAAIVMAMAGCSSGDNDPSDPVQIKLLSNRADLVSDGDALVEIALPQGASTADLKVDVDGKDVSQAFAARADGRVTGLITGLKDGSNVINASAPGAKAASLSVKSYPKGGPILSGAQAKPFFCATPTPQAATATTPATNGSGLSANATDDQCNIPTEYKYYYRTADASCSLALPDPSPPATAPANPCFKPYNIAAASQPGDLATTTTDKGATVPYIVRVERGTMNRGIYDIAVLVDPKQPWTSGAQPQATWNGKVNYLFGPSGGQPRRQVRSTQSWTDDKSLARGWMVAVNSMTDASTNNNRVMVAETLMMMKEHVTDRYGEIRFTVGTGCSGGSISAHNTSTINPGLLDGLITSCALLDYDTSHIENYECSLLVELYDSEPWKALMTTAGYTQAQINEKKAAINGHRDPTGCQGWFNNFGPARGVGNLNALRQIPTANRDTGAIVTTPLATPTNSCQLPAGLVYDPMTNPGGVRCGPWDWAASVYGKTADGTAANTTRDNTGIQYGLKALRAGKITPEEFVLLNERIGGVARDGIIGPTRSLADLPALDTAYRAGMITGRDLGKVAIIDLRGYDDTQVAEGITGNLTGLHHHWRSHANRERLDKANGHHNNHVMWRFARNGYVPTDKMALEALLEMDKWLTNLKADRSAAPLAQKVVSAKPATAFDYCLLTSDPTQSNKVTDQAVCNADPMLVPFESPRQAAGGPRAENIMKCTLKPLDVADYAPAAFTASQLARLNAAFPSGVCDWTKPGVAQRDAAEVPLSFAGGPGGQPLSAAPASQAK